MEDPPCRLKETASKMQPQSLICTKAPPAPLSLSSPFPLLRTRGYIGLGCLIALLYSYEYCKVAKDSLQRVPAAIPLIVLPFVSNKSCPLNLIKPLWTKGSTDANACPMITEYRDKVATQKNSEVSCARHLMPGAEPLVHRHDLISSYSAQAAV